MAWETHKHFARFVLLAGLLIAGIALIALPTPVDQTLQEYSAQVTSNELDGSVGFAPPGYYSDAHIIVNNAVTVTLKLVLVTSSSVLFSQSFQAGTLDIPRTLIAAGGNVFLTIQPSNNVFTQMNVLARIFHTVATYPFAWVGLGVIGLAGLFAFALSSPQTRLGKLVYKILPVIGRF